MVNVDTVYQTVQALANKEQRGYLTPQEFNLLANQAQQDIFEQYFYDLEAFRLRGVQLGIGEKFQVGDSETIIREKIKRTNGVLYTNAAPLTYLSNGRWQFPPGRNGKVFAVDFSGGPMAPGFIGRKKLNIIDEDEYRGKRQSRWFNRSTDEWFVFDDGYGIIRVLSFRGPVAAGGQVNIRCENVTGKPGLVIWNYSIVNEKPVYNATSSKDFDLPIEEQPDLVVKVLKLAGISIEDPQLYQLAGAEDQQNIQQENK